MALPREKRSHCRRLPQPKTLGRAMSIGCAALLGGCDTVLMKPSGDIAAQQAHLIEVATVLMLLVVVPVIAATLLFAWRYRHSNPHATYAPDWDHSLQLELLIWAAPLLIIISLGAVTWISTHTLDPFRPLARIDTKHGVPADTAPLQVDVVALDWKWLFIYPAQGVAAVNELAAPIDVPLHFNITSESVMNSFFVPALAGQIYAMPGMQTQLNAVMNRTGRYQGFSANYSGAGFSQMRFALRAMSGGDFDRWVQATRAAGGTLDGGAYLALAQPSGSEPARYYGAVSPGLYEAIVNRCVAPGSPCIRDMRAMSARPGRD